jgi:DNA-binding response OmpR family regulator
MPATRILIVEDHGILREELVHFLGLSGFQADGVSCGLGLDDWLMEHGRPPDIAIVDLNLPGEDGFSIAQRLRHAYPRMGLVVLTGRKQPSDRIGSYDSGADVYLSKPVSGNELLAVIRSLQRRLHPENRAVWRLDRQFGSIASPDGSSTTLTGLESAILATLATSVDQTAESSQLLLLCADKNADLEKNYLEVTISRLRRKLTPLQPGADSPLIRAVRGKGYQLLIPLEIH